MERDREGLQMTNRDQASRAAARRGISRRTFTAGIGAAGIVAGTSPFSIGRAQGAALKVRVLLPRSGFQAGIGQDCHRGVEIAGGIFRRPHRSRHQSRGPRKAPLRGKHGAARAPAVEILPR